MSSSPPRTGDLDAVGGALLRVLLRRVEESTPLLEQFRGALADARETELEPALAELQRQSRDLGWVLGVLASSAGGELLGTRREARGLEPLLELLDEALAGEGRGLERPPGELPLLCPAVGQGWELPWVVASLLHAAARTQPADRRLNWSLTPRAGRWALRLEDQVEDPPAEIQERIAEVLPQVTLEPGEGCWTALFPADWWKTQEDPS